MEDVLGYDDFSIDWNILPGRVGGTDFEQERSDGEDMKPADIGTIFTCSGSNIL